MSETTKPQNLYQKLLAIGLEIGTQAKTGEYFAQGKVQYKFLEQAAIMAAARTSFESHGVVIIAAAIETNLMPVGENAKATRALVKMLFTVINADNPEERIESLWTGEAIDYGDKAVNKALTAAKKTFYIALFNISDHDPDADDTTQEPVQNNKPAPRPAPQQQARPLNPAVVQSQANGLTPSKLTELVSRYRIAIGNAMTKVGLLDIGAKIKQDFADLDSTHPTRLELRKLYDTRLNYLEQQAARQDSLDKSAKEIFNAQPAGN